MSETNAAGIGAGQGGPAGDTGMKLRYKALLNKRGELSSFRCALFMLKIVLLWCLAGFILTFVLSVYSSVAVRVLLL